MPLVVVQGALVRPWRDPLVYDGLESIAGEGVRHGDLLADEGLPPFAIEVLICHPEPLPKPK